uniref:Crystaline entomocidal protoxin n=1 Tax=Bacillus thuringiensis TaxID=1428 RepID=G8XQF5_BACTU|nr:cry40-like protein [Bacillus thuringiensis]
MNSYENKNEYEILESSSNNTNMPNRYPFANDRDISPMSWNDCQGSSWEDVWESTSSLASIGIDLIDHMFIAGPSITSINLLFSIIGKLIPSSGQSISSLSICDLLSIIRKEVDESVLSGAYGDFNGVLANYRDYYLKSLKTWLDEGQPTTGQSLKDVTKHFEASEREFNALLQGSLSRPKGEILLLPTYAQGANFHLLLLRDFVQYKDAWANELRTENVESELISPTFDYEGRFKEQLAKHINHCIYWYQAGLDQIKQGGTGADIWTKFNKFRREMTLSVLDIIAIFPTYDFEKYPLPTHVELTREIYTDAVGYSSGTYSWLRNWPNTFNALEANGTRGPGLVTWLSKIGIYNEYVSRYFAGWVGTRHYEDYTKGNGIFQRMSGTTSNDLRNIDFQNADVYKITSLAIMNLVGETTARPEYRVSKADFRRVGGPDLNYDAGNNGLSRMTIESTFPLVLDSNGVRGPSHRLSNAACVVYGNSRVNVFGWTHTSMTKNNPIYTDKISQIPAVKAFEISNYATVYAGPGHTGGGVVGLTISYQLKIRLAPASTNKNYRVRVRYASTSNGRIRVERWSPSSVINNDFPYSSTGSRDIFGYVDTLVTTFYQSGVEIIIQNIAFGEIIIDKVELIPLDSTTLEYDGEQNLKKAQNVVNDLFTN